MPILKKQLPKYCLHKSSRRAFVRISGKMYYLGKYGSEASRREYDRIIAEFIANGRRPLKNPDELLVEDLIVRFLDYAEKWLGHTEVTKNLLKRTLRFLNELYGKQLIVQFTPTALKSLRQKYIDEGLARSTINYYIGTIKNVFAWGCEEELVPSDIAGSLKMVKNLLAGRTSAIDYDPVEPVADDILDKTLPHLKPMVQDMVKIQRRIGGRPQDIFNMRFCDIDTSGEIWEYVPFTHKSKKRGKKRRIYLDPKSQQMLQPYFDKCTDQTAFVFMTSQHNQCSGSFYRDAIRVACKKAGIEQWSPNQLRHAGGTEVRDKYGLDYAQAVLGHARARTTEIYAKPSDEKAIKVAKEIG